MSLLPELSEITAKLGPFKAIVNQCLPVAPEFLGSALKSDGRAWERLALPNISEVLSSLGSGLSMQ